MRFAIAFLTSFALVATIRAGDNAMLDRFAKQNDADREKVRARIKEAIDKAQALEKDDPAAALALLQETRDRMLQKAALATRADRELTAPVWEKINVLHQVLLARRADEVRAVTAEYRDYLVRMNDEFAALRKDLVIPGKEPPPGQPAYITLITGRTLVGWLQEPPQYVVRITIEDQPKTIGATTVAGVQTIDTFYLSNPTTGTFEARTPLAFFVTAVIVHPPATKTGFWMPAKTPAPPDGFYKSSPGVYGASLFSRSAGALMTAWCGPAGQFPERAQVLGRISASTASLLRNAAVDLQVRESFAKLAPEDQAKIRDMIIDFLDRRERDDSLKIEEVGRLGDQIAEAFPDRRGEMSGFLLRLGRVLDVYAAVRKNG